MTCSWLNYIEDNVHFVFTSSRKPAACSYVYPYWRPYGSLSDDTISSVSSQDTDRVNPLLYGLVSYKHQDNLCYPVISSLYHVPQVKVRGIINLTRPISQMLQIFVFNLVNFLLGRCLEAG